MSEITEELNRPTLANCPFCGGNGKWSPKFYATTITCDACGAGLYFLWDQDEMVYVGEAINAWARLQAHRSRKEKTFTRATFLSTDRTVRKIFEIHYIAHYRPKFNKAGLA